MIYVPRRAKCICKSPRPAAPKYPPAPMTGPGESCGQATAARTVTPRSESSQPAGAEPRLIHFAARKQHGIEHGQRKDEIISPHAQSFQQSVAHHRAGTAADVVNLGVLRIDQLAGRIGRDRKLTSAAARKTVSATSASARRSIFKLRCSNMANPARGDAINPKNGSRNPLPLLRRKYRRNKHLPCNLSPPSIVACPAAMPGKFTIFGRIGTMKF